MANQSPKKLFKNYIDSATDLAESIKRNIIKGGVIDDKTVNYLNDFMIATNALANMEYDGLELENEDNEFDTNLN